MSGVVFLRTFDGGMINAAVIERIEEDPRAKAIPRAMAILTNGRSVKLSDGVEAVEDAFLPVVAATPGYMRLRYHDNRYHEGDDEGGPLIERMPIVAWRISDLGAHPITPGDDLLVASNAVGSDGVLTPDGLVIMGHGDGWCQDEAAWREAKAEEAEAERAKAASADEDA